MPIQNPEVIDKLRQSLAEDIGRGDLTSEAVVPADLSARAKIIARSATVAAGLEIAPELFRLLDPAVAFETRFSDGERVPAGASLAELRGRARAILSAERTALNLLQRMCGIASETRRYVEAVAGTPCRILDTRKTAPGLRAFDKLAVRAGGGVNHRFGLDDGILIKDNHRRLAGGVGEAVRRARRASQGLWVEAEVESEGELREALAAGADMLLLDNRSPEEAARLAEISRGIRPEVRLEASGGIALENARAYAEAGVDLVSVGALTHSVRAADLSLEILAEGER